MSVLSYLATYTVYDQFEPGVTDAYNGDSLRIEQVSGNNVRFYYVNRTSSASKQYWDNATGTYYEKHGIIVGTFTVPPPRSGGEPTERAFSIALDRALMRAKPEIHVFVKRLDGGAPDEGSFTGQGN